jgi:hypothetical protein
VKNHQQIIIHPGNPGEANIVEIQDIPDGEDGGVAIQWLEYRVLTADSARKLVYFEVQARKARTRTAAWACFDGTRRRRRHRIRTKRLELRRQQTTRSWPFPPSRQTRRSTLT